MSKGARNTFATSVQVYIGIAEINASCHLLQPRVDNSCVRRRKTCESIPLLEMSELRNAFHVGINQGDDTVVLNRQSIAVRTHFGRRLRHA